MTEPVLVERRDRVLVVTIDRPHVRNAVDRRAAELIGAAMDLLDEDADLMVGVLAGAGGTFCSGMDLKAFGRGELPVVAGRGFGGLTRRPPVKPLVAAVEGHALAGGFELVLACDLVVAADDATFGLPEVRRGLTASGGGLLRLPRRVPANLAAELVLTGRPMGAAEAYSVRLVNRLCAPGAATETALDLAAEVAENAPLALAASKQVLERQHTWAPEDQFDRQEPFVGPVRASRDAQEGARAFVERRAPGWVGR